MTARRIVFAIFDGLQPIDLVGALVRRCGFATAETLRRVFQRRPGVAPAEYRDRFRTPLKETP